MTRIKCSNVQLGSSFVVPIEQINNNIKIQEVLREEQEILIQAEQKARKIIDMAKQDAHELLETAKNQALSDVNDITQKAYQDGFETGHQEGLKKIINELEEKVFFVNNFAESNFEIKKNIIKSAHLDIVRLVVEISHKICSKSLELDETILKEITLKAIQALKDKEDITIIVNPEMAEKIYSISEELKEQIPQLSSIKIIEDNSVSPDGTIVESPLSRVDCRVTSQIGEVTDKLLIKLDSTPIDGTENEE